MFLSKLLSISVTFVLMAIIELSISGILLATDLCLSWPKVLNLVTVRGVTKTPV